MKKISLKRAAITALASAGLCLVSVANAQTETNNANPNGADMSPSPTPRAAAANPKLETGTSREATRYSPTETSSSSSSKLSAKDKAFLKKAARGGMKEVEMGQMGVKQAKSPEVRRIGERMVTDHSAANHELMGLAKQKGVGLPTASPHVAPMKGENFDHQYLMALQKDHQEDIADFEKEAGDSGAAEDADVKAWAAKTLPVLKEHLQMVNDALAKTQ